MRTRYLVLPLVGLIGTAGAAGAASGLTAHAAAPTSASFTTVDFGFDANGGTGHEVTIAQGGTVSFGYPTGHSEHNVDFNGGPKPSSCTAGPPIPGAPAAPGWSGSCTFSTPGTYTFHCDLHPFMTGTVVVSPAATGPTGPTGSTGPSGPPVGSPITGSTASAIRFAPTQHGTSVRGIVAISAAGQGGTVQVQLFAPRKTVMPKGGSGAIQIGNAVSRSVKAGTLHVTVALDRAAIAALRRVGKLGVSAHVTVRSTRGTQALTTRNVTLET